MEVGGFNAAISGAANRIFVIWVAEIAACVAEGQKKGEIIDNLPPEDIAEYIHSGISGAFSRMKVNRNRDFLDKWYKMTFDFISKKE